MPAVVMLTLLPVMMSPGPWVRTTNPPVPVAIALCTIVPFVRLIVVPPKVPTAMVRGGTSPSVVIVKLLALTTVPGLNAPSATAVVMPPKVLETQPVAVPHLIEKLSSVVCPAEKSCVGDRSVCAAAGVTATGATIGVGWAAVGVGSMVAALGGTGGVCAAAGVAAMVANDTTIRADQTAAAVRPVAVRGRPGA